MPAAAAVLALALLVPTVGCGGMDSARSLGLDGGGTSDASLQSDASYGAVMLIEPGVTSATTLVPGEVLSVSVTITGHDGMGLEGKRIEFALLGQSMDTSLSALVATTDVDGEVLIYLRAGQKPSSFQLRITYDGSISYVPIVVQQTVQSSIVITIDPSIAPYVSNAAVRAYAGRTCDTIDEVPPSATLEFAAGTATAELTGLSSGTRYAVMGTAVGAGGYPAYSKCVDVEDPSLVAELLLDFGIAKSAEPTGP